MRSGERPPWVEVTIGVLMVIAALFTSTVVTWLLAFVVVCAVLSLGRRRRC